MVFRYFLIACVLFVAPWASAFGETPPVETAATPRLALGADFPSRDAKLISADEIEITLGNFIGEKGTLVIFSCNHCPFVKAWEGRIAEIGNTYKPKGVQVVVINSNDPSVRAEDDLANMKLRSDTLGFEFPYVVDKGSAVAKAFGASRTPEVFLFDAQGKLAYWGAIDDNSEDPAAVTQHFLKDALNALLEGREVPTKETKAVGCSIKFYKEM